MKIESRDQDIRTLLSSGFFRIPRFQRPYSWTRENVQEFWDDVIRDNPADYFIGSMVVFKDGKQRFGVVDGQQRLTTITVFLAVLRNTFISLNLVDLAEGIQGLIERKNIDNKPEFILSTETSYPFFQEHILKIGETDTPYTPMREEENLKSAFDQFKDLIDGVVQNIETDSTIKTAKKKSMTRQKLVGLRDAVLNLNVILVSLDNEDDAYIIFETLNTRGKDLSLTDLVKNFVNKNLKTTSASDPVKVKWEKILETIEGASGELQTDTYIHHFWLSRHEYIPAKALFKQLKRRNTAAEVKAFLQNLLSDSTLYRSIHEVSFGKWSKQESGISDSLKALQLFRVQQQTPCVLSLVRAYKDKKIKMKHLSDSLVSIEKFHFLFTAVTSQRSSGGISAMYALSARKFFEAKDQAGALLAAKELKGKLRQRIPVVEEVKALFPQILFTDSITKQKPLVKYILRKFLELEKGGIAIDYESMTIEHLVPQSQIKSGAFSEEIVGQLGNLVLVSSNFNNSLMDKKFPEKKAMLKAAGLLPADLENVDDLTTEIIRARTQSMAEEAHTKIWKI